MDRRTFLGAATAGLALLWFPRPSLLFRAPQIVVPDAEQMLDEAIEQAPTGPYLTSVTMVADSYRRDPEHQFVKLVRPDGTIAAYIQARDHLITHTLPEPIFGPVRMVARGPITATAYGRKPNGELVWSTYDYSRGTLGTFFCASCSRYLPAAEFATHMAGKDRHV